MLITPKEAIQRTWRQSLRGKRYVLTLVVWRARSLCVKHKKMTWSSLRRHQTQWTWTWSAPTPRRSTDINFAVSIRNGNDYFTSIIYSLLITQHTIQTIFVMTNQLILNLLIFSDLLKYAHIWGCLWNCHYKQTIDRIWREPSSFQNSLIIIVKTTPSSRESLSETAIR